MSGSSPMTHHLKDLVTKIRALNAFMVPPKKKTIDKLPDKLLLHTFSFLRHYDLCIAAQVCKKWRMTAYDSRLWQRVSLRPDYSHLYVHNIESLLALISVRFGNTLRYIELPSDLVTVPVIHELANKCPNLKYMTLDFAKAMQLHDFNDLQAFPCNLYSLCICLSEVIFMEGFMRKVYQSLSSLQILHLIGTFEQSDEEEEEIYEVINISKIKTQTPNLRVVNLYGISFVDDSHIELLSSNCIHLECLALNFCLRVRGSTFKVVNQRCKKLVSLLLQHTGIQDKYMQEVDWENSKIHELDITSTELSTDCLIDILCRMPGFTHLAVGNCDFFTDRVLELLMEKGKLNYLKAIDISYTPSLGEEMIFRFLKVHGNRLRGVLITGIPQLIENFWLNVIPYLKNIKILSLGTANGWFLEINAKVHIDQLILSLSQNCPDLERLEIQWDPDTIRHTDNSSKFIDILRMRCPLLRSLTLSDGEYYEMVKSNCERADRLTCVRTTTNYKTNIVSMLKYYNDLLFN